MRCIKCPSGRRVLACGEMEKVCGDEQQGGSATLRANLTRQLAESLQRNDGEMECAHASMASV